MSDQARRASRRHREDIPNRSPSRDSAGMWALGSVSMLMDISSEMIHALLPVYMVAVLGTSILAVGAIEGIAKGDHIDHQGLFRGTQRLARQAQIPGGARLGLAALTKPIFPLASSLDWLVAARFIDRMGKGIRGAPVTRLSPISRRLSFAARASACASRSIRSAPLSDRSLLSA